MNLLVRIYTIHIGGERTHDSVNIVRNIPTGKARSDSGSVAETLLVLRTSIR